MSVEGPLHLAPGPAPGQVPYADDRRGVAGDQGGPAWVEGGVVDGCPVAGQGEQWLTGRRGPDPDHSVGAAGRHPGCVGAQQDRPQHVWMYGEEIEALA